MACGTSIAWWFDGGSLCSSSSWVNGDVALEVEREHDGPAPGLQGIEYPPGGGELALLVSGGVVDADPAAVLRYGKSRSSSKSWLSWKSTLMGPATRT